MSCFWWQSTQAVGACRNFFPAAWQLEHVVATCFPVRAYPVSA
jgi:hypothetical protein